MKKTVLYREVSSRLYTFKIPAQKSNPSSAWQAGEAAQIRDYPLSKLLKLKIKKFVKLFKLKTRLFKFNIKSYKKACGLSSNSYKMKFPLLKKRMSVLEQTLAAVEKGHSRTPVFQQQLDNSGGPVVKVPTFDGQSSWSSIKSQSNVFAQANK
ncbi:hypothetical protein LAZ67_6003776 [Cordylochernes scorpioides]|uniref:Uncharacterized protein n=1 Tax=Cordylochernes scorpioides TaxID=51811 RepID=A0ABY6KLW4_9ARAC|nr:hypothetical protein LAZ67_6003776 [Cordylochernes scorpioides]